MSTPQDQLPDDSLLSGGLVPIAPRSRPVSHLKDLTDFAQQNQLTVGSTTSGRHNRGSKHYTGNAVDIAGSGKFSDDQVASLSKAAAQAGLLLRDERTRPLNQKVWGGPHVHIEYDEQSPANDSLLKGGLVPRDAQPLPSLPSSPSPSPQPSEAILQGGLTPAVTSTVREADTGAEIPSGPATTAPVAPPISFQPASQLGLHPTTDPSRALSGPGDLLMRKFADDDQSGSVEQQMTQRRLDEQKHGHFGLSDLGAPVYNTGTNPNPSTALGKPVKVPFSPHLNPTADDVVKGYLTALGPDYAKYGEQYRQQTGHDILSLSDGNVDRDTAGNFYVQPSQGAIRVLNAYVQSRGNMDAAKAEAAKIAGERTSAVSNAQQAAKQDVADVETERKAQGAIPDVPIGVTPGGMGTDGVSGRVLTAPLSRFVADLGKTMGGLTSLGGLTPNAVSDYFNRRGAITEMGASLPPLTAVGKEIERNAAEKVGTALGDIGFTVAKLVAMKKVTGLPMGQIMALETALNTSDEPATTRAAKIAKSYAMGNVLEGDLSRTMSAAVFGIPTAVQGTQQVLRDPKSSTNPSGKSWEDVLLDTAVQGGVGAIMGGSRGENVPTELAIDAAPRVGVPGEATANIDARLAAREAAVRPPTQPEDIPAMRVRGAVSPTAAITTPVTTTPAPQGTADAVRLGGAQGRLRTLPPPEIIPEVAPRETQSAIEFNANRIVGPTKPVESAPDEGAKLNRWQHRDFGLVTESADQSGAGRSKVRVLAEDGTEHIIQRPKGTGAGNQIAVPVRAKPLDARTKDAQAQAAESVPFKVIDRRGASQPASEPNQLASPATVSPANQPPAVPPVGAASEVAPPLPENLPELGISPEAQDKLIASAREGGIQEDVDSPPESTTARSRPSDVGQSTTSIKNAAVESAREVKGLPNLTPADHQSWVDAGNKAREQGLDQPDKADAMAERILSGEKEGMTAAESAGLRDRIRGLENQHEELSRQIWDEKDPERIAAMRAEADVLNQKFQRLTDASKKGGTDIARALAIRNSSVNKDFTLAGMQRDYKVATGNDPSPEAQKQIETLWRENKRLQTELIAHEERIKNEEASRAVEKIRRDVSRETRQMARGAKKANLDDEAAQIKQLIAQAVKRTMRIHGMAAIDAEGEIGKLVLKLARNRVQKGIVTADDLVDSVHGLLQDIGELNKRDIREMISGYGRKGQPRSEAQKKLDALKSELYQGLSKEDIAAGKRSARSQGPRQSDINKLPRQGPELREGVGKKAGPDMGPKQGPRNSWPARQKAIEKQIAEYTRRINEGDFSDRPKRPEIVYDRQGNALRYKLEGVKREFERLKAANQTTTVLDALTRWKRFAVLGFPSTLGKLGSAATGRMVATPLYELVGEGMRRVPGLKSVYQDVPRATLAGERAAISQLWQSDSFKDILRHLKGGEDMITMLYGEKGGDEFTKDAAGKTLIPRSVGEVLDRPGHIHAAAKVIPRRAAIFRTFENLMRHEQTKPNGRDVKDPAVQLALMAEAYPESQRASLQQPNPITNIFNRVVDNAVKSDSRVARGVGKALRFEYPITKVPVNFVGETALHIGGLPAGLAEVGTRAISARVKPLLAGENRHAILRNLAQRMPDAISELKPEERARIARSLKVGGVGLGFVVWGMMRPDQFGGYYQPGKRDPNDVKASGMRFMGVNIPRWMGHIPPLEAAQFGSTLRRVYDSMQAKEKAGSKTEAVKAGIKGIGEEIPFIDPLLNTKHGVGALLGTEGDATKFLGGEAAAMVPGAARQGAKTWDYPEGGTLRGALNPFGAQEPVQRKEDTVGQIVKGAIPGLRQTVPVKNTSGKLLESRGGDDPLAKELTRIDKQVEGTGKDKDETPAQYAARRAFVNPKIESDLRALVATRGYKQLSDKDKEAQITMHLQRVTKQANDEYRFQTQTIKPRGIRPVYIR